VVGLTVAAATAQGSPRWGYWLGQPYWGRGFGREAVAAIIDHGFRTLGLETVRACTDPANVASQRILEACGLRKVAEIDLVTPMRLGARRAPLFRLSRQEYLAS
jgi:RimJ/RimL family protein N-acetyltransferase